MPIYVEVNEASTAKVAAFLQRRAKRVTQEVTRETRGITLDLQTYIKERKLSGRPGLRNITGTLRHAINKSVDVIDGKQVIGVVGVGPEASKYAKIHEFGGTINVPAVDGRLMVFPANGEVPTRGRTTGGKWKSFKGLKGFKASQLVFTRKRAAFTVHIPQRSYLRSSLAESRGVIIRRLNEAVRRGATE